ncbi:hypothetical protein ACIQZG_08250 [Lysinibacillus sp. NPDC096418]|uniref:hypothetical protein n=1 Tax=Lysinibacillus sp. NPDC096418 TaxID=3364138 RepID=UPI00382FC2D0
MKKNSIRVEWRQSYFAPGNKMVSNFKNMKHFEKWRNQPMFWNIEILSIEKI